MFVFYAHGGSDNHGCEAIIRGTCQNLEKCTTLYSGNMSADIAYGINDICRVCSDTYKRYNFPIKWLFFKIIANATHNNIASFRLVDGKLKGTYLSVGGDNYCYPGLIRPIINANNRIRRNGNATVLWGTSIEDNVLDDPIILGDIAKYDWIFARESLTYKALCNHGLAEKSFLFPDPAFAMPPKQHNELKSLYDKGVIGINISPLIMKFDADNSYILKGYLQIIQYILDNTDSNILLIPHVVKRNNDDRDSIKIIRKLINNDRIYELRDMPADMIKYSISKCEFFIGARTHSTIAAYSTCVPTMVIGYSVKATGIAEDIFGTSKDYVIDVRESASSSDIMDAFKRLYNSRDDIRIYLEKFMPSYISRTKEAVNKLIELTNAK